MENRTQFTAGALLDKWAAHAWDDGVQLENLDEMDALVVVTQNSTYAITVIWPATREILIRGGRFFPELAEARLSGASLGGSFLKIGGIYAHFKMEINAGGRMIITSRVRSITRHRQSVS